MDVTRTAFGSWNGGRFMHFGEALDEGRWIALVQRAWESGIRTFITADVYGSGQADSLLGRALSGFSRDSYCLVGAIGHDFYSTRRDGAKGFPRFTEPGLRSRREYGGYLRMAAERSLSRLGVDRFDALLLHNPDSIGYSDDSVWGGLRDLRDAGLTTQLGVAPGPANGFTLDLIQSFERFGEVIDWAMIILSPLEPWPGRLVLEAAAAHQVRLMTRVVDYGGVFHDDVRPGHRFGPSDHRSFRPPGWVDAGYAKLEQFRSIFDPLGLTALQFACSWNLAQKAVECVVPTLIQEVGDGSKPIEKKVDELSAVTRIEYSEAALRQIAVVGDNTGCMTLKGAALDHVGEPMPDRWGISGDLAAVASRWSIDPLEDLRYRVS